MNHLRPHKITNIILAHRIRMSWAEIRKEAEDMISKDSFVSALMRKSVIDHESFGEALSHNLAHQFADTISASKWEALFLSVYKEDKIYHEGMHSLEEMGLRDLGAIKDRDPACDGLVDPFVYFKGFKALQCHRIAHVLWRTDRKNAARAVQGKCSELFGVDIHPAAVIGKNQRCCVRNQTNVNFLTSGTDEGLMIDHGTGVVIGETAVIGKNCSFLHGVTLGSSGVDKGDRHPKIGHDVLIGCNAAILGNICVGNRSKVGSGSMVLRSVPAGATVVGNPARIVGLSMCKSPANAMDLALKYVLTSDGRTYESTFLETEDEKWVSTMGDHVVI